MDDKYCAKVGTDKQHSYATFLASKAGYSALRYAVAEYSGRSVSKCGTKGLTVKEASGFIEWLKKKVN
jgi:hypothetical protein